MTDCVLCYDAYASNSFHIIGKCKFKVCKSCYDAYVKTNNRCPNCRRRLKINNLKEIIIYYFILNIFGLCVLYYNNFESYGIMIYWIIAEFVIEVLFYFFCNN